MKPETFFFFGLGDADGNESQHMLLGGKGANLAGMAKNGFPVPPGVTIPTMACLEFRDASEGHRDQLLCNAVDGVMPHIDRIREHFGYLPLFSVRSGAPVSMPGMMDTILNVGLTSETLPEWKKRLGSKPALDSYRRLIQMFGNVVYGINGKLFEDALAKIKSGKDDSQLTVKQLEKVVSEYKEIFKEHAHCSFPDDFEEQLRQAIEAVFLSWDNDRAIKYRELNGIDHDMGTAVNIQSMVFGNLNDKSATGVMFTRCPSTGNGGVIGEFLVNAQGEDVVAGIRTPQPLNHMESWNAEAYKEIIDLCSNLEAHYKDMQDIEFTIQDGELFVLQTRNGKRSSRAAFKIASDMVSEGSISLDEARKRLSMKDYFKMITPVIDPNFNTAPVTTGIPAGGAVISGVAVFSSEAAVNADSETILVAQETTPEDIEGMDAAIGILTSTGGLTSHAAVVARGMNKTCVVGCTDMTVTPFGSAAIGDITINEGDVISIDGHTGHVWIGQVPVIEGEEIPEVKHLLQMYEEQNNTFVKAIDYDDLVGRRVYIQTHTFEDRCGKGLYPVYEVMIGEFVRDLYDEGYDIIIDMRSRAECLNECDNFIEFMTSPPMSESELFKKKIAKVVTHLGEEKAKAITYVIPTGCTLPSDWKTIGSVETIKDLMSSSGIFKFEEEKVVSLFGDYDCFNEFMGILEQVGKKPQPFREPTTRGSLVRKVFGGD